MSPNKLKYLGLHLNWDKSNKNPVEEIQEKINKKLVGWKAKLLSQAGRTTLIKSVGSSIPAYTMSSMLLPKTVTNNIDKSFRKFWWGFDPKKTHTFTPKAWSSICKPKSMGGLGLRPSSNFNKALLCKLGWTLLNSKNSLWKSVLSSKYLKNSSWLHTPIRQKDSKFVKV